MKFLTRRVLSLGAIILIHVAFSIALIMAWTIINRGWDFSVTAFPNERFYASGGQREFNIAAILIGSLFKYLHINHLIFYLINVLMSTATVIVFFHLASTCLNRKLSLYITAIFAFNPELAFYNNFVLKENLLILVIIVAMYFFFKALTTNLITYKILFCLFLPLIFLLREPLIFMGILPLAFFPKPTRRFLFLWGAVATCVLIFIMHEQSAFFLKSYYHSHIGYYGATKTIFEDIFGVPTSVTFGTLFSSPALFIEYIIRSLLYYLRPGWNAGVKLNSFLVPYTLFAVYVFLASFRFRKYLTSNYRAAYLLIAFIVIMISTLLVIYDPIERYRYSVFQLSFTLLILNFKGYQERLSDICPQT